jgi:hypothetical protein
MKRNKGKTAVTIRLPGGSQNLHSFENFFFGERVQWMRNLFSLSEGPERYDAGN